MAPLVGDLIMEMRALGPDLPQVMAAPLINSATATTDPNGLLPAATYFAQITQSNLWGQTLPSSEFQNIAVGGVQNAISFSVTISSGATQVTVYIGTSAGGENFYQAFPVPANTNPITVKFLGGTRANQSGTPPQRSTAYLPDTDGGFVSATACYRWLNEAMDSAARITEGIPAMSGVTSVANQRRYVLNGQWLRIDHAWFNGWELTQGTKGDVFYNRNIVAGISNTILLDEQADTTRIELYWTPNLNGGQASTNNPMLPTDTGVSITTPIGWQLSDGFIMFGSPGEQLNSLQVPSYEICHYQSQTGTAINGLIRGYAGTLPQAWPNGTNIFELNIMLAGMRMPIPYAIGSSTFILSVPPGWKPLLAKYMLAKFREAEQERQEAASLFKEFTDWFTQYAKSNKQIAGPRQLRMYDDYGIRGVVPGGLSGGIIVP